MPKFKSLKDYKDNPFVYHQIKIAKRTLEMNDIFSAIMGGPTKTEAKEILKKYNIRFKEID